jgi:hypothetical protein
MDRPRIVIACILALAFVALGVLATSDVSLASESVLEQNTNNDAMMAKLQAEAANLKRVLARQQAEKQALAQSEPLVETSSKAPAPSDQRTDSSSGKDSGQVSTGTGNVQPVPSANSKAVAPARNSASGSTKSSNAPAPSDQRTDSSSGKDSGQVSPVAEHDARPSVEGIVPEMPAENPNDKGLADEQPTQQQLPKKSSQHSDDDELQTIWKFYDQHQAIFNVVWIVLGVLAAAMVVGLLHHGCTTGNNVKNRRVYH